MRQTHSFAIACAIMLAAAAIFIQPVIAQPIDRAEYAPSSGMFNVKAAAPVQAPLIGGILVVNDPTDADIRDDFFSLREAIRVSSGAFIGPFTIQERGQMPGCTFDTSGQINGGCGIGYDTIQFAPSLAEIILTSNLPQILLQGVRINGAVSAGNIIINGNGVVSDGFRVKASQVTLTNLTIINITSVGRAILLENGAFWGLQIYNNYLGVLPGSTSCGSGSGITSRPVWTIVILGGSGVSNPGFGTAYIDNNVIGCALADGIQSQDAPYVYIGANTSGGSAGNWIGVNRTGANIGNNGSGISLCCSSSTIGNQIIGNHIGYNGFDGIRAFNITYGTVNNNDIFNNSDAGIHLISSSAFTFVDNTTHGNGGSGIWLDRFDNVSLPTRDNLIFRGAYYQNGEAGISEDSNAGNNTWSQISTYDNAGLGIDKDDNGVPGATGGIVITSIVQSSGVVTVNGQYNGAVLLDSKYHVELYRLAPDLSGYGEGRTYLGAYDVTWNLQSDTTWHIRDPRGQAGCYTALLTVQDLFSANSTSYEFAANFGQCRFDVFLPAVLK
jgi:hypothetical protein